MISWCSVIVFFFQAEDGIRDLVRSRGLGDVYKRQGQLAADAGHRALGHVDQEAAGQRDLRGEARALVAVSYTHLTLPTSDLV